MPRAATDTRERILDAAEALILDHGFAATSIDKVLEGAGITKGAFFYHFKSKGELARALVDRFARLDAEVLAGTMARAEKLAQDPLQQVLIFVGLMIEELEAMTEPACGCLFASFLYENRLFDDDVREVIRKAFLEWRTRLGEKLAAAMEKHPPTTEVDAESLADLFTSIIEGAYIMSKSLRDPKLVARQIGHYRRYLELLMGEAPQV